MATLTTAIKTQVLANVKVLKVLEAHKLTLLYGKARTKIADKLTRDLYIIHGMEHMINMYDPDAANNWVTEDEANTFIDEINKFFKTCNIRTESKTIPASIENGVITYSDGTTMVYSDGTQITY